MSLHNLTILGRRRILMTSYISSSDRNPALSSLLLNPRVVLHHHTRFKSLQHVTYYWLLSYIMQVGS
jgi:hypothetical protein